MIFLDHPLKHVFGQKQVSYITKLGCNGLVQVRKSNASLTGILGAKRINFSSALTC